MIPATKEKKGQSMAAEKIEYIKKKSNVFQFDPTIHAGHILTMITIVFCSIGAWYDVKSSVALLKEENVRQAEEIKEVRNSQKENVEILTGNVNALALMNRQDMTKIRDDMNDWFIRINDKLDKKADKK